VTNAWGLFIAAPTGSATNKYGAYFGARVGIATTAPTAMLHVAGTLAAATDTKVGQAGVLIEPTVAPTGAVSEAEALYVKPAFSGTITTAYALYTGTFSGGTTANYALYAELPTGATNNYGAYIGGRTGIAIATPTSILHVSGTVASSVNTMVAQAGVNLSPTVAPSAGVSQAEGVYIAPTFTVGSGIGTAYGVYVATYAVAASNNYALYVEAPTGASTANGNYAAYFGGRVGISASAPTAMLHTDGTIASSVNSAAYQSAVYINTAVNPTGAAAGTYTVYVAPSFSIAGGAITAAHGMYIAAYSVGASVNYGLFVGAPSGGSNNHGIVSMGRVGVGTGSPVAWLNVNGAVTSTGSSNAMVRVAGSGTAASSTLYYGIQDVASITAGSSSSYYSAGLIPAVDIPATVTMSGLHAIRAIPSVSASGTGTGTLTTYTGVLVSPSISSATAGDTIVVSTYRGLHVTDVSASGLGNEHIHNKYGLHIAPLAATGTPTGNYYGIYVDTVAGAGTGNYGIISMSKVGIGTATPEAWLQIDGSITAHTGLNMLRVLGSGTFTTTSIHTDIYVGSTYVGVNDGAYRTVRTSPTLTIPASASMSVCSFYVSPSYQLSATSSTATLSSFSGYLFSPSVSAGTSSTLTITNTYGTYIGDLIVSGGGTVAATAKRGIYVHTMANGAPTSGSQTGFHLEGITGATSSTNKGLHVGVITAGTSSTNYGVYVSAITGAATSTNYGIYVAAPSGSGTLYGAYFGGKVGIADATPTAMLQVSGSIASATNSAPAQSGAYFATAVNPTGAVSNAYAAYISPSFSVAGGTIANAYGLRISAVNVGATSNYGLYVELPTGATGVSGAANYAAYFGGRTGIASTAPAAMLQLGGIIASSTVGTTTQSAVYIGTAVQPTDAVSATYSVYIAPTFSVAGGAITSAYGLRVATYAVASGTSNYGLYVDAPTGSTGSSGAANYAAYFGGKVGIANTAPTAMLTLGGTIASSTDAATSQSGVSISTAVSPTGAVGSAYSVYVQPSFNVGGGAITNAYGMRIATYSVGATSNYGIYIEVPTGATGSSGAANYAAYFGGKMGIAIAAPTAMLHVAGTIASSTDSATAQVGAFFNTAVNPTGAVTNAYAVTITPSFSVAGGAISNAYGLRINTFAVAAGSNYGLYVTAPTGATDVSNTANYAAYFSGKVGIATSSPATMLSVSGTMASGTDTLTAQSGLRFSTTIAPTGSGTITTAATLFVDPTFTKGSIATWTTAAGIYVDTYSLVAATNYGLYVDVPTSGTANFGVGTSGSVVLTTAGGALYVKTGTNACAGTVTFSASTTATVTTTCPVTNDMIFVTPQVSGTLMYCSVTTFTTATSFVITCSSSHSGPVNWFVVKSAP
jgi:hypothetical protein